MAQFARPILDSSISGTWVNQDGGTTDLYLSIDETPFSDADYIQTAINPADTDFYDTVLSGLSTPLAGNHILRYRIGKDSSSGRFIQFVILLFNSNGVEIAQWIHSDLDLVTQFEQTLTAGQLTLINSYTNLHVRINPTVSGGGAARAGRCYWVEFETPDADPNVGVTRRIFNIN